jgi:hypothetical protein
VSEVRAKPFIHTSWGIKLINLLFYSVSVTATKLESGGYWIEYAANDITVAGGYSRIFNPTATAF